MNTLLKTIIFASAVTSVSATAAITVSDTNSAIFNIGGTIDAMCKVKSN
jgi:hypothetical protein